MKKFTMKNPIMSSWSKRSAAIGSMLALTFFAACGDDVTDNDPVTTQGYESEEAFPKCDADYEGYFATLLSSQDVYICTAKNWVNISKAGSNAGTSSKASCTAEELSDGTGVEITCNGKKSVLQYGKQGAQGDPGKAGSNAENGKAGEPGGKGKDGDDAVPDADRCFVKYEVGDVVLFECGDSTYVRSMDRYTQYYGTWDSWKAYTSTGSKYNSVWGPSDTLKSFYNDRFGSGATGSLVRFEGDDSWESPSLVARQDFVINKGFAGTATVNITEAQEITADKYRPFVGIRMPFYSAQKISDIAQGGGFCLTYSSDSVMALLLKGDSGYVKAEIPATENGAESVVDISIDDFKPVTDSVNVQAVMGAVDTVYIEVVGGEAVGTYSNKFGLYQFGSYGSCNGQTFSKSAWKTYIDGIRGNDSTFTDGRDGRVYKTVTIGDQTWLAEDLKFKFRGSATDTSICLGQSVNADTCETYGQRYTWLQAVNNQDGCVSTSTACSPALPDTVQGICPNGWHLPSMREWGKMVVLVRGTTTATYFDKIAFLSRRGYPSAVGGNESGLDLVMYGTDCYWWTSYDQARAFNITSGAVYNGGGNPITEENYTGYSRTKTNRFAVRCVKDAE